MDLIILIAAPIILAVSYWLAKRAALISPSPEISFENAVLAIRVPKENEKDALAAEQMFSSLHGLLRLTPGIQEHITFEIAGSNSGINFYAVCPRALRAFVESQVYAQYPAAEIKELPDYAARISSFFDRSVEGTTLTLAKPEYFPIRTFREFEVDPLAAITSAISQLKENEEIWIQIMVRPIPDVWQSAGHNYVSAVRGGATPVKFSWSTILDAFVRELGHMPQHFSEGISHPSQKHALEAKGPVRKDRPDISKGLEEELKAIEFKLAKMGFQTLIRLVAVAPTPEQAASHLRSVTASFRQFSTADLNSFVPGETILNKTEFLESYQRRSLPENELYVLGTEELASVFHLPSISVETPLIAWSPAKKGEPPLNLPTKDCTYIGRTTFRDSMVRFGLKRDDRTTHFYAVGKTGTGKTTLFKNMIIQDIYNGEGVGVVDPHGDLIEELLDYIPENRLEDVVIFDPGDFAHPVALNVLECNDIAQKNLMASGLVSAIRKHFENSWGPRLEYLLNNAVLTLLEVPSTTMLGITRLLEDKNYQKYIVHKIKDPILKDFWENEFKQMMGNTSFHTEAIAPIQNKIGRFLSSSTMRNILGQARSSVQLDNIMNQGKILLVNLSKGKIGEDNANLLGSLLISRINFMAMQRVQIPIEQRRDFYLYVDEFQNFASSAFGSILSEARKYRLCLHMTHQYTAQLEEDVREAVFGNVGTMVAFSVGAPDAHYLAPEFAPYFEENDLISLERHHIYVKMMIDGMTEAPFSAVTDPPLATPVGLRKQVVELARKKFSTDSAVVEDRVRRWTEKQFDLGLALAEEEAQKAKDNGSGGVSAETIPAVETVPVAQTAKDETPTNPIPVPVIQPVIPVIPPAPVVPVTPTIPEPVGPTIPFAKEPDVKEPEPEPERIAYEPKRKETPASLRFNPLSGLATPIVPAPPPAKPRENVTLPKNEPQKEVTAPKAADKSQERYMHKKHEIIIESHKPEGGEGK